MDRFIGLDVHASSCTFAVMGPSGRHLKTLVVETNGQALVGFLKTIPGTLHLCLEECTQAAWLTEILSPHVKRLVVLGFGERAPRGNKDDQRDAFALADKLRKNDLSRVVYKKTGQYTTLRQLVKVHAQVVKDVARVKNRIRAMLRSRGIRVEDKTVYSSNGRVDFLEQLPKHHLPAVDQLYAQYDVLVPVKDAAEKELVAELRRHAISRTLMTCPGLGAIRVAQIIATVVTPDRFRTRQQFWSYCGLGIVMRSSSDWEQGGDGSWKRAKKLSTRGLNRSHNRMLKAVFKGAATTVTALRRTDEPLRQLYERQLAAGTNPNLAKLTLARKLAATTLAMWKKKEAYEPKRISNE